MTNAQLDKFTEQLKRTQARKAEIEKQEQILKQIIQDEMTARNEVEINTGLFIIRWTPTTSKRFDSKAFKAANPSLYSLFMKSTQTRRFSIA